MTRIESKIKVRSEAFRENAVQMQALVDDLDQQVRNVRLGGGEVGYLRLRDMERTGFSEFWRHFPDEVRKGALVVDLRGNVGGHISELLLAKLAQRPLAWDVPRRGTSSFVFPYGQFD